MILSEIISFTLLYTRGWFDEGRFILGEHLRGAYASWESSRDRVWRNGNAAARSPRQLRDNSRRPPTKFPRSIVEKFAASSVVTLFKRPLHLALHTKK